MDSQYNSNKANFTYSSGQSSGTIPMEMDKIPERPKYRRLNTEQNKKYKEESKWFLSSKFGFRACKHRMRSPKN